MGDEPKLQGFRKVLDAVLAAPGELDPAARRAAVDARGEPPLAAYLAKVAAHAYKITDEEVQALIDAGCTEDQIFEASICTALGAGLARFEAGLRVLDEEKR